KLQTRLSGTMPPSALSGIVVQTFPKSVSLHWEFMFTRSMFSTPDQIRQHELLTRAGELIDAGVLRTTLSRNFGKVNAANLSRAHEWIETNRAHGKIVLEGF
ncbi:zinc-binding dehydrogenase, partial [Xanthomonas campestris pv. trichodesmae]|nr:zinc-binding dehydrogenase [Xanthomonas campestris pv. trichodesmae]